MAVELYDYQIAAVKKMRNGCILCGGVGSGKSRTALAYYYLQNGGNPDCLMGVEDYVAMDDPPKDLYIITTARKRDTMEWEGDLSPFLLSVHEDVNLYSNQIVVDSWNNIKKYEDVKDAFFIFDEQRVIGSGAWVKAFLKITKSNQWILLSATPGDTWQDYIPVFIANGFYKNRTEFIREHVVYSRFSKYPKIDRYLNTGRLIRLRNCILVNKLVKNKIHAVLFILLGALSVPVEWDATFFLFTLIMGGCLFFSKENWIYEGEEDDGTSREKTCSKVKAKRENHYIQSHKGTTRCHGSGKNRRRTYQSKAGGYR